jgi:hypothetical protein
VALVSGWAGFVAAASRSDRVPRPFKPSRSRSVTHGGATGYKPVLTQGLARRGFSGFVTFGELHKDEFAAVPATGGVHVVLAWGGTKVAFLATNPGGRFKDRDPTVKREVLRAKWIDGCEVVYIGKGDALKSRVKHYPAFGAGKPVGHWGGRYIWQIRGSAKLLVAWKKCAQNETAAEMEARLLRQQGRKRRSPPVREHQRSDLKPQRGASKACLDSSPEIRGGTPGLGA